MQINYQFLPEGASIREAAPNAFYVEVGGIDHRRVFDHHNNASDEEANCAAMIWEAREHLAEYAQEIPQATIYTHIFPDWNACWGVWLLNQILAGRVLEGEKIKALNTYGQYVLSGFNPSEGPVEKSALAVFQKLTDDIGDAEKTPDVRDRRGIEAGLAFFQFCYDSISDYQSFKDGSFLKDDGPYGRTLLRLREDYPKYLEDLKISRRFTALVKRKSDAQRRIDGLRMGRPTCGLFKFWAREDREHSYSQIGFRLLWVYYDPDRWFISVDPASGYTLEGLADLLTAEERRLNPPDPDQPNRPGFDHPNPWYDARNTPDAFTLVDAPRGGSRIPPQRVVQLLRKFFKVKKWKPAIAKPTWIGTKLIPYGVPLLSLLAVIIIGWWLINRPDSSCEQWRNLRELAVRDGKHHAIVIGVNDYSDSQGWRSLKTPKNDAEALMRILTEKYHFEPVNNGSILIADDDPSELTSLKVRDRIEQMFLKLKNNASMGFNDSVLIYFAGHGEGKKDDIFAKWILADGHYIDDGWLVKLLRDSNLRHILIIPDCCYSAKLADDGNNRGVAKYKLDRVETSELLTQVYQRRSRQTITSGGLETVSDGRGEHSPFASCLLDELENNDKTITASDLFKRIYRCTNPKSEAKEPHKYRIPNSCDMQGEFVFRRK